MGDPGASSGISLRTSLEGHAGKINGLAWSPDGRYLVTASADHTTRVWDAETGVCVKVLTGELDLCVSWSPDGGTLASGGVIHVVLRSVSGLGQPGPSRTRSLARDANSNVAVAWSPDGSLLASGSGKDQVRLWSAASAVLVRTLRGHAAPVTSLAWSPDGRRLASGSADATILVRDPETGAVLRRLAAHEGRINGLSASRDGRWLASASGDATIRVWEAASGRQVAILEGHTGPVLAVSFSADGRLLASKSSDGTVRLWRVDGWQGLRTIPEPSATVMGGCLAFHPRDPVLASLGNGDTEVRVWDLRPAVLAGAPAPLESVRYANAKVVLVGDSGVGKSGLGLALCGRPFAATESTHGRRVSLFESREIELADRHRATCETLLWDLAGQPSYRLIHQLHLGEVAVALVVFDCRSETDPFGGVRHWDRALRNAARAAGGSSVPLRKFLVAARLDRGGIGVSRDRIDALVRELGFDGYFETSAKEGRSIPELQAAIRAAIDWNALPAISSTSLFLYTKGFLLAEKRAGRVLSTQEDLFASFGRSALYRVHAAGNAAEEPGRLERYTATILGTVDEAAARVQGEDLLRSHLGPEEARAGERLRALFETSMGRVESAGLIRRLSFGSLVLLQPELLDAYASSIVNAAREEPEGTGSITEEDVREGRFRVPAEERLADRALEKLLLLATIEDLLRHEIALREQSDTGPILVFPSQFTRENPALPDPPGKSLLLTFEGSVISVYSTLAIRLSHSGVFRRREMWKNGATFTSPGGHVCGVCVREMEEGAGELTVYFDDAVGAEMRLQFEEYVQAHLERRALPGSVKRRRVIVCGGCREAVTDRQVQRRRELGHRDLQCPVCGATISLLEPEDRLLEPARAGVHELDRSADSRRSLGASRTVLEGKRATGDFDVFLCHNSQDKPAVRAIGERLRERGILPWLDEWELRPGLPWQRILEEQVQRIRSAAVFVGPAGIGPWQDLEQEAFLRQFQKRRCPVIPVLLPGCPLEPELPLVLERMTFVDFRKADPDPLERLLWGITGEREWPKPAAS